MSELKVRAARVADESEIMAIAYEEMRSHADFDQRFRLRADAQDRYAVYLRDRMRDLDSCVFVAELDGKVAGLAVASIRKQETFFEMRRYGYVSDLMVAPAARRQGIGRALYERIVMWFQGLGVDVIRLHVAAKSEEARAFWNRLGAEDFLTEAWIELPREKPAEEKKPAEPNVEELPETTSTPSDSAA